MWKVWYFVFSKLQLVPGFMLSIKILIKNQKIVVALFT